MPIVSKGRSTIKAAFSNPFEVEPELHESGSDLSIENFLIEEEVFEYPLEDAVPAGYYACEVKFVEPRRKNEKIIIDVSYEIIDQKGNTYYIKQAYPVGSKPMRDFSRAMIAAGVKAGSNMSAAIGVREVIELAYVSKSSALGSIVDRIPETQTIAYKKRHANTEGEFEDSLHEDDF